MLCKIYFYISHCDQRVASGSTCLKERKRKTRYPHYVRSAIVNSFPLDMNFMIRSLEKELLVFVFKNTLYTLYLRLITGIIEHYIARV